jgi:hypothetical protein
MTAHFSQNIHHRSPANPVLHINHIAADPHRHGHHRNLPPLCLLFSDSTRRFSGFLEHQHHFQSSTAQSSFGRSAHGVYDFPA